MYTREHFFAGIKPSKAYLVVCQVLEGLCPRRLSHLKTAVDVMIAVQQNLWLNDGHETRILQESRK